MTAGDLSATEAIQIFAAMHGPQIMEEQDRIERDGVPCLFDGCPNKDVTVWLDLDRYHGRLAFATWNDAAICQEHGAMLTAALRESKHGGMTHIGMQPVYDPLTGERTGVKAWRKP